MSEMVGERFGRLIVIEKDHNQNRGTYWKCQCDCGNIKSVRGDHLQGGKTKSCSCLRKTRAITHNMTNTGTYEAWEHIKQRCSNHKDKGFHNYGGRGIKVCNRWLKFENFYEDMGNRPEGLTIERKNNELGYYKENCKWATYTEQARNKRIKKNNKTGVTGIHWNKKTQKYCVQIRANNKTMHVGLFTNIEEAINARKQAEQKYWGKEKR